MITAYLTDSIVWVQSGGVDQYGEPATGTETTIAARVEWGTRNVRTQTGDLVVSGAVVSMTQEPSHADKLRIDGVDHRILAVHQKRSFSTVYWQAHIA